MCELHIRASDNLNRFYNIIRILLKALLQLFRRFKIGNACFYSTPQRLMILVASRTGRTLLKVALDLYVAK